ncbi:MAG: hypothetical protein AAF738_10830, partial [Bacteroidota bacterium]
MLQVTYLCLVGLLLLAAVPSYAQSNSLSNQRSKFISTMNNVKVQLDSLTVVPESIQIFPATADSIPQLTALAATAFVFKNDSLTLRKTTNFPLWYIEYRVLPFNLGQTYTHFDSTKVSIESRGALSIYRYDPFLKPATALLDFGKLDYNGSFSRGLSFGNNQNL